MCFKYLYIVDILCNFIQSSLGLICLSHHNHTLMVGKFGCIVYIAVLLAVFLGGSVLEVDLAGAVKKKRATSGFGLKVIIGG